MKNYWFSRKGQRLLDNITLSGLVEQAWDKREKCEKLEKNTR